MKCNNEKCDKEATQKTVHVGVKEVFYCDDDMAKYQAIMRAMGAGEPVVYQLTELNS